MKRLFELWLFFIFIAFACNKKYDNSNEKHDSEANNQAVIDTTWKLTQKFQVDSNVKYSQQEYLNLRDKYVDLIKTIAYDDFLKLDSIGLKSLEIVLKKSMIDSNLIINKVTKTQISLYTLIQEMGFGRLDGLVTKYKEYTILYTSRFLLEEYMKQEKPNYKVEVDKLNLGQIAHSSILDDGHFDLYANLKINPDTFQGIKTYGFVGATAQDFGVDKPNYFVLLLEKNEMIYVVFRQMESNVQIKECYEIWESADTGQLDMYQEENKWNEFCNCYNLKYSNYQEHDQLVNEAKDLFAKLFLK